MASLKLNVPLYAKNMLWMTSSAGFEQRLPESLQMTLPELSEGLTLRWGTAQGSPLRYWSDTTKNLIWNGHVRVNGHIDCSHLMTLEHTEILILEIHGSLIPLDQPRMPSLEDLKKSPFERSPFLENIEEAWYAFVLELDSPFADFTHHALVNGQAIDCYGRLADEAAGFHRLVGLPLLLESLTLYAG